MMQIQCVCIKSKEGLGIGEVVFLKVYHIACLLQSGWRYTAQQCKLNWFKNSFVSVSVGILNSSLKQG